MLIVHQCQWIRVNAIKSQCIESVFLLVNSPNQTDKWRLIHVDSALQSTYFDKNVAENQGNLENQHVEPAVSHQSDHIKLRLKKIFGPTHALTFIDKTCKIGSVCFKSTKSLFNFVSKGSIFSMSKSEASKLKKIVYCLPSPKRKLININALKYLDLISDDIYNKK